MDIEWTMDVWRTATMAKMERKERGDSMLCVVCEFCVEHLSPREMRIRRVFPD